MAKGFYVLDADNGEWIAPIYSISSLVNPKESKDIEILRERIRKVAHIDLNGGKDGELRGLALEEVIGVFFKGEDGFDNGFSEVEKVEGRKFHVDVYFRGACDGGDLYALKRLVGQRVYDLDTASVITPAEIAKVDS
ncbi:hypothetical protein HOF78_00170 [Candidatus Woesearchaeota archaeon]|jgi:hypothetical protein|nr:hypothetical protein [Candidatus Woesearchaeota archaeon]MBT6044765.1 hypothetical protein [Candidatus Woesearchaeota archaeon]